MRIHTVMVVYVLLFARFFSLSRGDYALLFLAFGLVIGAEMFNTAAEGLTDMKSPEFSKMAKNVKDIAAGAVFVCAVFSVCVAVCLFWQPDVFVIIGVYYAARPLHCVGLAVVTALSLLFIWFGLPFRGKKVFGKAKK